MNDAESTKPDGRRDAESRRWSANAAAWEKWADRVSDSAAALNAPLIAALDDAGGPQNRGAPGAGAAVSSRTMPDQVSPPQTSTQRTPGGPRLVVDLASGAGEPVLTLAERSAPDDIVLATDLVPQMLYGILRRARARAATTIRAVAADMTRLPLADGSVNALTCRFGMMFVPDPVAAAREAYRVLRPDGVAVFMLWGPLADNTVFRVAETAAAALAAEHPGVILALADPETAAADTTRGVFSPFRFTDPAGLVADFKQAGFAAVTSAPVRVRHAPPLGLPFWTPMLEMMYGPQLAALAPPIRAHLDTLVAAAMADLAVDGPEQTPVVPLEFHAWTLTARRI